jgi:hypothetical protein
LKLEFIASVIRRKNAAPAVCALVGREVRRAGYGLRMWRSRLSLVQTLFGPLRYSTMAVRNLDLCFGAMPDRCKSLARSVIVPGMLNQAAAPASAVASRRGEQQGSDNTLHWRHLRCSLRRGAPSQAASAAHSTCSEWMESLCLAHRARPPGRGRCQRRGWRFLSGRYQGNFCNFEWEQCMKPGLWNGRRAERR